MLDLARVIREDDALMKAVGDGDVEPWPGLVQWRRLGRRTG